MSDASAVPPARPGDAAIAEELASAKRSDTREAYAVFIARHPDHPLVAKARARLARLEKTDRHPDALP